MEDIITQSMGLIVAALVVLLLIPQTFVTTRSATNKIIERFGKFVRVTQPGLTVKIPFIDRIAVVMDLRLKQLNVMVESKTKDNVFVNIPVAVQYRPLFDRVPEAYYSLSAPEDQIRSYVFDTIRTTLAALTLDEAYSNKDAIANDIESRLQQQMAQYGYQIANTLVTDISPTDPRVRESMNRINAAQREREAASAEGEAVKIRSIKAAEAEAETKRLQGVGVASQRKAIVEGLAEQYEVLRKIGIEESPEQLLMMTQYFDTLRDIGTQSRTNTIFVPSNAGGLSSSQEEIRNTLLAVAAQNQPTPPRRRAESHTQESFDDTELGE
ncbi:SPFH domain-containing protein [Gulosibacter bifidus]|uniref:SPFH domain-containing protein n=1 Tax=Gulosibacter bifidus TaxID=272239 RepID=A0ABW5RHU4_9MICO|nr:SPFH domain-containing protein [Gulosibacter bifidus]